MEEPVTTEEGLTYEKSAIEDHFKTNGFTEPISRAKMNTKPYPNQALKNAVLDFLDKNPWAYEHFSG
jgi:STIP1 homology and U-box containing protein 1